MGFAGPAGVVLWDAEFWGIALESLQIYVPILCKTW